MAWRVCSSVVPAEKTMEGSTGAFGELRAGCLMSVRGTEKSSNPRATVRGKCAPISGAARGSLSAPAHNPCERRIKHTLSTAPQDNIGGISSLAIITIYCQYGRRSNQMWHVELPSVSLLGGRRLAVLSQLDRECRTSLSACLNFRSD